MLRAAALLLVVACLGVASGSDLLGQSSKKPKRSLHIAKPSAAQRFTPTFYLDSNSVGNFFFPANLGAAWTIRRVTHVFDDSSRIIEGDTVFSIERIVNDSALTLQGLPYLICENSVFKPGSHQDIVRHESQYYVDDSVVMAILNNSVSYYGNHTMLVNPLKLGAHWKDQREDTLVSRIVSTDEVVTTSMGTFHALVVTTTLQHGELAKYFVRGVGIVKTVFRGLPPSGIGAYVVTNELVNLDRGIEMRNLRRYQPKNSKQAPVAAATATKRKRKPVAPSH